ncbi:MAG: hypothetical protein IPM81_09825 [Saprospirales bacterium]|nr:hypothetical protein [Saprospirales bacterium]
MDDSQKYFEYIRSLIASDKLDDALKALMEVLKNSSYLNEAIMSSARNAGLKKHIRLGLLDQETIDEQSGEIKESVLDLIDEIESARSGSLIIREESDKAIERFILENKTDHQIGDNVNLQNNTFEGASYIAGTINNYYAGGPNVEDAGVKSLACPYCGKEASPEEVQENGKVYCKNPKCGKQFFELKPIKRGVIRHLNVPEDKNQEYDDLIFRVNHHILLGQYAEASVLCDEAFAKHPQSPAGLEYKALCIYLTTPKMKIIDNAAAQILVCLGQAREIDATSQTYDGIAKTIAYKYYGHLRARIRNNKSKQYQLFVLKTLVDQFETCYRIYPDVFFLEEKVNHLSGQEGIAFLRIYHDDGTVNADLPRDVQLADKARNKYLVKDLSGYEKGMRQEIDRLALAIKKEDANYGQPRLLAISDEYLMENGTNIPSGSEAAGTIPHYLIELERFIDYRNNRIDKLENERRLEEARRQRRKKFILALTGFAILMACISVCYTRYSRAATAPLTREAFLAQLEAGQEYPLVLDRVRLRSNTDKSDDSAIICLLRGGDLVRLTGTRYDFECITLSNGKTCSEWMEVEVVGTQSAGCRGQRGWLHPAGIVPADIR